MFWCPFCFFFGGGMVPPNCVKVFVSLLSPDNKKSSALAKVVMKIDLGVRLGVLGNWYPQTMKSIFIF